MMSYEIFQGTDGVLLISMSLCPAHGKVLNKCLLTWILFSYGLFVYELLGRQAVPRGSYFRKWFQIRFHKMIIARIKSPSYEGSENTANILKHL